MMTFSRKLRMTMLNMTHLYTECLIRLTKLRYVDTPFNQTLKQNAKRDMRFSQRKVTQSDVMPPQPVTTNLLFFLIIPRQRSSASFPYRSLFGTTWYSLMFDISLIPRQYQKNLSLSR